MSLLFSLIILALLAAGGATSATPATAVISPWFMAASASVFLCGLICDAYLLGRFTGCFQLKVSRKPWGLPELGLAVAVCLGVLLFCNILYLGAGALLHKRPDKMMGLIIPVESLTRIGLLIGFAFFFRSRRINLRQSIGLDILPAGQALRWGIVFGCASLPPVLLINLATDRISRLFHFQPSEQDIALLFRTTDSTALLITLTIFAVVLAPVFEEFLFRGFAYPALKQRIGPWPAMAIVSAVFALSHFHAPSLPALMLLAIGLVLAYELTGSLITPITMHAVFNGVMVLKLFYDRAHS